MCILPMHHTSISLFTTISNPWNFVWSRFPPTITYFKIGEFSANDVVDIVIFINSNYIIGIDIGIVNSSIHIIDIIIDIIISIDIRIVDNNSSIHTVGIDSGSVENCTIPNRTSWKPCRKSPLMDTASPLSDIELSFLTFCFITFAPSNHLSLQPFFNIF